MSSSEEARELSAWRGLAAALCPPDLLKIMYSFMQKKYLEYERTVRNYNPGSSGRLSFEFYKKGLDEVKEDLESFRRGNRFVAGHHLSCHEVSEILESYRSAHADELKRYVGEIFPEK